jgi:hypothetical protein
MPADRSDFLLKMYDQMFNDIDTHILVVWQSVAVVVGAFAVLADIQKRSFLTVCRHSSPPLRTSRQRIRWKGVDPPAATAADGTIAKPATIW